MGLRRVATGRRRCGMSRNEVRLLIAMTIIFFIPMAIYLGMHPHRLETLMRRAKPGPPPAVLIPPGSSLPGVPTDTTESVARPAVMQPAPVVAQNEAVGGGASEGKDDQRGDGGAGAGSGGSAAASERGEKAATPAADDQKVQPEDKGKGVDDGEGHEDTMIDLEQEADHAGPRNRKNRDKKGKGHGGRGGEEQRGKEGKDKNGGRHKGGGGWHGGKGGNKGDGGGGGGGKHGGKRQEEGEEAVDHNSLTTASVRGGEAGLSELPWPFYKIGEDMDSGHGRWPWPGCGWKDKLSVEDAEFKSGFKFYLYDEGPMNLEDAIKCFHEHRKLDEGLGNIDSVMRVNEREYFTEFFLLPALKDHPQRTLIKSEASLFVVGWSNMLARYAKPCKTEAYGDTEDEWDDSVASLLEDDAAFKKNGGKDFLFLNSRYKNEMTKRLKSVLDSGPIIATFDRFSGKLMAYWRKTWKRGSVLVMPYVSSAALDLQHEAPKEKKDPKLRYYFRGNMHRWHGERSYLPKLAEHLTGADFQEVVFSQAGGAANFVSVLEESADDVRQSSICPSPEGDTPTSLRLFESLVAGCVPVVIGQANLTAFTLPFPSLINYDDIALFTRAFKEVIGRQDGIQEFGRVLETFAGPNADPERAAAVDAMRKKGMEVYEKYFSYFRNPRGVATAMLFEAWVMQQQIGILKGPHGSPVSR